MGKLRRIYHGIYTDDLEQPLEHIIQKEWMSIVSHVVSQGILSFRTAYDLKPTAFEKGTSIVFVTSSYTKTINLPGLIIKVLKGNSHDYKEPISLTLSRSNEARMLLENLSTVNNKTYRGIKTVGQEGVERYLTRVMRGRGESALNRIRDEAKNIATDFMLNVEYKALEKIISALLSTHHADDILKTPYAKAMAKKEPYDEERIRLFESLALYIKRCHFKNRAYEYNKTSFNHLSFFESYFSNYIEGTRFSIDEAEDIVFKNEEVKNRHADSHDVSALYHLTNDYSQMSMTPHTPLEFLDILQSRHAVLMQERPDKRPGEFKKQVNIAGNTYFVMPNEVIATLTLGFELYSNLQPGIEKALFMHFLVSEVHPFEDGNGRIARIMMNAELVQAGCFKIIIPTVHRDNYINGLRRASRDHYFQTYCKVIDQAQAYTETIPWVSYEEARDKLEGDYADRAPDEGLPIFNRALRQLQLSECPP
ncbi:MAG: Fic family protein [Gammaproteobacteria bacterium]